MEVEKIITMPTNELKNITFTEKDDDIEPIEGGSVENEENKDEEQTKNNENEEGDNGDNSIADKISKLQEENEKLSKKLKDSERRIKNQERFLGKIGTEIGLLRKRNPEEYNRRIAAIRDLFYEDENAAIEEMKKLTREEQEHKKLEEETQLIKVMEENYKVVSERIPEFENSIDEIAEIMAKEDGESNSFIEHFKDNPYFVPPVILWNLHRRASMMKEIESLKAENASLQEKLAEAKKSKDKVLSRVEEASRQVVSGRSGGTIRETPLKKTPISMTTDELKRFLRGG